MPRVSPATQRDAIAFCDLCQWVYECWVTHLHLFDRLPAVLQEERSVPFEELMESASGRCLHRLNEISWQYCMLQIAKLHDSARQGGAENLSVGFFVHQQFWSEEEESILKGIVSELNGLYERIKDSRNKILVHNDRSVYAEGVLLGNFQKGQDEKYFLFLGQFCSMIWGKFHNRRSIHDARRFDFSKSGMREDPICPSADAREPRSLVVGAFPKFCRAGDRDVS